jgi:hypothetical protein
MHDAMNQFLELFLITQAFPRTKKAIIQINNIYKINFYLEMIVGFDTTGSIYN